jgi:hypothetical protein
MQQPKGHAPTIRKLHLPSRISRILAYFSTFAPLDPFAPFIITRLHLQLTSSFLERILLSFWIPSLDHSLVFGPVV